VAKYFYKIVILLYSFAGRRAYYIYGKENNPFEKGVGQVDHDTAMLIIAGCSLFITTVSSILTLTVAMINKSK